MQKQVQSKGEPIKQEVQNDQSWIKDPRYINEIAEFASRTYKTQDLHQLSTKIDSQDIIEKHRGIIGIRKILVQASQASQANLCNLVQTIIDQGFIPKIIQLFDLKQFPHLREESTWTLSYVLEGKTQKIFEIFRRGGALLIPKLLQQNAFLIADRTVLDNKQDEFFKMKAIMHIVNFAQHKNKPTQVHSCCWAVQHLCSGVLEDQKENIRDGIAFLCQQIANDKITEQNLLQACLYLIKDNLYFILKLKEDLMQSFIHRLTKICNHTAQMQQSCKISAIIIINKLAQQDQRFIDYLMRVGILKDMKENLNYSYIDIRQYSYLILANLAKGTQQHVHKIIKQDQLIAKLLYWFEEDHDVVKQHICFIFSHLNYHGQPKDIFHLYQSNNIVKYYYLLLKEEAKTAQIAMQCLISILTFANKFTKNPKNPLVKELIKLGAQALLQKWQCYQNDTITDLAKKILAFLS